MIDATNAMVAANTIETCPEKTWGDQFKEALEVNSGEGRAWWGVVGVMEGKIGSGS